MSQAVVTILRKCSKCGEAKPVAAFYRKRHGREERAGTCSACDNAIRANRARGNKPGRHIARTEGGMTLEEIATVLGVSRQRVQRIEARALRKLATAARKMGFRRGDLL